MDFISVKMRLREEEIKFVQISQTHGLLLVPILGGKRFAHVKCADGNVFVDGDKMACLDEMVYVLDVLQGDPYEFHNVYGKNANN